MPVLKNYTAQLGNVPIDSGRRASAADFGGETAAALERLGGTTQGVAEKLLQQKETDDARQMLTGIARLTAQYTQAQQDAIASGADLDQIREKFQADLAGLRDQAVTNHGAQTFDYHEATTMQSFDLRTGSIKAQKAAAHARTQVDGFMSGIGQQVFTDPSSLAGQSERINAFVANLPGISPEMRNELKQEMVFRANSDAVRGAILIDPEGAKRDLEAGKWTLKEGQLAQEIARAESQIDAKEARRQSRVRFAAWERDQASEQKSDLYIQQVFRNQLNEEEVNADPTLVRADRQALIAFNRRWWDSVNGEGRRSDPTMLRDLTTRIYASEDDPRKLRGNREVLAAVNAGTLTVRDARWMMTDIANQRDPNNSTIGAQFYGMMRSLDSAFQNDLRYSTTPGGRIKAAEIMNRWSFAVRGMMNDRRERNQSLYPLFDPTSKEYVGNPAFIKQFELGAGGMPTLATEQEVRDYEAMNPGGMYLDAQGNVRRTRTRVEQIPQ